MADSEEINKMLNKVDRADTHYNCKSNSQIHEKIRTATENNSTMCTGAIRKNKYISHNMQNKSPYRNKTAFNSNATRPHQQERRKTNLSVCQEVFGDVSRSSKYSNPNYKIGRPHLERTGNNSKQTSRFLSYRTFLDLSSKNSSEIITFLINRSAFEDVLNSQLRPDLLVLIIKVLAKSCSCEFKEIKATLINISCGTNLLNSIESHIFRMPTDDSVERKRSMPDFILDLLTYFETIMNIMPNTASEKLKNIFINTDIMLKAVENHQKIDVSEQKTKFKILDERLQNMIQERNATKPSTITETETVFLTPPDCFRSKSIYPTEEDLFGSSTPFLRPGIVKGAYLNVEHYLDVQFRLLREDCVSPLREGLKQFLYTSLTSKEKKSHKVDNIRVYKNVKFTGTETLNGNIAFYVNFDPLKRMQHVKWEYSKIFMFGSLLLFSNDNFNSIIFGSVVERNMKLLKNGTIAVTLRNNREDIFEDTYVMIESEIYFEPYYHVMKALQRLNEDSFPMEEYIIFGKTKSDPPKYMMKGLPLSYDIDSFNIRLLDWTSWPNAESFGLDKSQMTAFRAALTEEFVVIQGPPGTGKTFLGLKIAKALLRNINTWNEERSPILVVCYTNHALDQFLHGLLNETEEIVRMGGQSKSVQLNKFTLHERRKSFQYDRCHIGLKGKYHKSMLEQLTCIKIIQANLEELEKNEGILSVHCMKKNKVLCPHHVRSFENSSEMNPDNILHSWLVEGFDEFYGFLDELDNGNENCVDENGPVCNEEEEGMEEKEEDEELEEENFRMTMYVDPVYLDVDNVTHNVTYAVSFRKLQHQIKRFKSKTSAVFEENQDQREYHQQLLYYWTKNLNMNYLCNIKHMEIIKKENIWKLSITDRWRLYKYWLKALKLNFQRQLKIHMERFRRVSGLLDEIKQMGDLQIMAKSQVVGITTTNAARLQTTLQTLKPKLVIVEEAAEILESHVVASLTKQCEHVILIGDHKQLKPSHATYKLACRYNFDLSLFERMVNNGLECYCLDNQHRMRPEIAKLIVPSIYPELKNDLSVYNYPTVRGITKSLYFISHNVPEEKVGEIKSHKNVFEAKFLMALCRHLILQGYQPDEITILATYKGQMFYMKQEQKNRQMIPGVNITVVDNYQGEENRIILLSLVRSNEENSIGFLKIENRVCVALSRAREGLYIIGNMDNLTQSSKIWPKIKESLEKQESFGKDLLLQCAIHPDQQTKVSCAADFIKVPEGGCSLPCQAMLKCGHKCESICHANNREHAEFKCYMKCERIPLECDFSHQCPKLCYEICGSCKTYVERALPCGHVKGLPCHIDYKTYKCMETVEVELPNCQHLVKKICHLDIDNFPCYYPCTDRLPCGHSCMLNCHTLEDPDHLQYKCMKRCPNTNVGCENNHKCLKMCHEECGQCDVEVLKKLLFCEHEQKVKCSEDLTKVKCLKKCTRTMDCGHKCNKKCFENCDDCQVKVIKRIPECGHNVGVKCSDTPTSLLCDQPCQKKLKCGHKCVKKCMDDCEKNCPELVPCSVVPLCGHKVLVPCYLKEDYEKKSLVDPIFKAKLLTFCEYPCRSALLCGHKCKGTCGECMQGRIHIACGEKCSRNLICGHTCKVPCSTACPPCSSKCENKCKHSKCKKVCGFPCINCKEPCGWACKHLKCTKRCFQLCDREPCYEHCKKLLKCGHECIGFCGDKCPPLCKICNEEEVKKIFFGTEDQEDARFVYLEDCKHTLESEGLEMWLSQNNAQISQKTCPLCKTPIMQTVRFMKYQKLAFKDIQKVKRKYFMKSKNVEKEIIYLKNKMSRLNDADLRCRLNLNMYKMMLSNCEKEIKNFEKNDSQNFTNAMSESLISKLRVFIDLVDSISLLYKGNVELKKAAEEKIHFQFDLLLKKMLKRHTKFGPQETSDFNRECKRFFLRIQLAIVESCFNFSYSLTRDTMKCTYEKACSLLESVEIHSDEKHAQLKKLIDELKKYVGVKLSDRERQEIVSAMKFSLGHWFKCPNGHVYCIGDCGGAMEVSRCPECGESIGGQHHRLLSTNALASEMDGAVRHAYPGGLH